ncbi:MAG: tetratricopeptide (TPR) repeat protein [Cryomorphaceae bacterium]|jgi:tetratricopeptide (TPR) repeat protein
MNFRVCPSDAEMQKLEACIASDQMLQAYELVQSIGPLDQWDFGKPLRKAALLMSRLGNRRKANILDYLNVRDDRNDPKRLLHHQYHRMRYVPLVNILWDITHLLDTRKSEMDDTLLIDYLLLKASIFTSLRDFGSAHKTLAEAKAIKDDYSWFYVQQSDILEKEDRYEESLEVAERAIVCDPLYHNALLQRETALFNLNRDDEAIELLEKIHAQVEHGTYAARLQYRYSERGMHQKAMWAVNELDRLSPLMSKKQREWCQMRRADFLYMEGDLEKAVEIYAASEKKYYQELVVNLKRPEALKKQSKMLDVSFVRQHDMTCAPATMAAIAAYFGAPHDHLDIAEAICYDGTPWHKERAWAEDNGFAVIEFRMTEEIIQELIDKNLPFSLTTSRTTSAHLQACIGYDARSKVVFIRDPTERHYGEMLLDQLIKDHPVTGPRAMLFLPENQLEKITDTHFPDRHIYDCRHDMMLAMDAHNLIKIEQAMATMRAIDAQHPIAIQAEIIVSSYRHNYSKCHALKKQLRARFPDAESLRYDYFHSSLQNCSRDEQLEIAHAAVSETSPDPVFYAELGDLYLEDLKDLEKAEYYLKKSAMATFSDARSMASLATCAALKKEPEKATEFLRYASCKSGSFERYASEYFKSSMLCGKQAEAIGYLKGRLATFGKKESAPWITLSESYEAINRDVEARQTILDALEQMPDDCALLLHMVDRCYIWGYAEQAEGYLERVKPLSSTGNWHYAAGKFARQTGNRKRALLHFERVVKEAPTFYNGQHRYAGLLEEEYGADHAMVYLKSVAEQYPKNISILECYASYLTRIDTLSLKTVLEQITTLEPNNLWANRELARIYENEGDVDRSIEIAENIVSKQPNNVESIGVLGGILTRNDQEEKAVVLFKKAIVLDANYGFAFQQWMKILNDKKDGLQGLKFYKEQIFRQSAEGSSLSSYRDEGFNLIEPDEMLKDINQFREQFPHEWEAWIIEKDQLLDIERADDAEKLMRAAVKAFPHIPRMYVELASVYSHKADYDKQIEYLEKALSMSPSWDWCARKLAEAYELRGDYAAAEKALKEAIGWAPLELANHGCYAAFLKKKGKTSEAFDVLKAALVNDAAYEWGWREVAFLAKELERVPDVYALIELHDEARSSLESWWEIKFDIYDTLDDELALEHCETGINTFPKAIEVHNSKAYLLSKRGQVEQAIAATKPEIYGDKVPLTLRGRRADIFYIHRREEEAIELMNELVEEQPNYLFGISKLAAWYSEKEDNMNLLRICKQWLRHEPRSHIARGYQGEVYEKQNKLKDAAKNYQEAFQMNPEYRYAGYRGFELALQTNLLDGIPQTIALVNHFGSKTEALEMQIRYLSFQGKTEEAFQEFLTLIQLPDTHLEEIGKTVDLFPETGRKAVLEIVESGKAVNHLLLVVWFWGRTNYMKTAAKIEKLPYEPKFKLALWTQYLEWLEDGADQDVIYKIYRKYKVITDIDTSLWGALGRLLIIHGSYKPAYELLKDYQSRDDVEGWMMANTALAIASFKGINEAEPAIRHGVENCVPDNGYNYLASLLAPIEAAQGNDEASKVLIDAKYGDLNKNNHAYRNLAELILMASPQADKRELKKRWQIFEVNIPEWYTDQIHVNYVKLTKKAVKARGGKWVGKSHIIKKFIKI